MLRAILRRKWTNSIVCNSQRKQPWKTQTISFPLTGFQWQQQQQNAMWMSTDKSSPVDETITCPSFMSNLSPPLAQRARAMKERHDEIMEILSQSSQQSNPNTTGDLGKELSQLAHIYSLYTQLQELSEEEAYVYELLQELSSESDKNYIEEIQQECQEELIRLQKKQTRLEHKLVDAVIPKEDEDYEADAILEIRAGTGGDEASLFANQLLTIYEKTSKAKGWTCEMLHLSKTDLGGVREAAISITSNSSGYQFSDYDIDDNDDSDNDDDGDRNTSDASTLNGLSPYGFFKYESGVHRVQRVPINDVRIHTSTASVAVFPSSKEIKNTDSLLPMSELKIETFRASGAGGQHVNTTESAVRITHIPTGITAAIQDERSQHKNKAKAMKLIAARVQSVQKEEEAKQRGELRSSLIGGGGRSERIRTYNFPQDRVTDHRCKHSEFGIDKLLEGSSAEEGNENMGLVGSFAPKMIRLYREEVLKEMEG